MYTSPVPTLDIRSRANASRRRCTRVTNKCDRLLEAHRRAVDVALQEAENYAGATVRLDGANNDRQTGNLVVTAYTHDSSRQLDPQLHTHAVAANLSYDGVEGRWKALQASGIYERRAYITEVYRNELVREVRGLGYEIESQRNAKGVDNGFEIKGISKEVLERYSQRSDQRDEQVMSVFLTRQWSNEWPRPNQSHRSAEQLGVRRDP
jgi:conjugative relaxase-like TrwC/TraI family protein